MQTQPNEPEARLEIAARLPWRKPEIQRLTISLDTADSTGSFTDGPARELFPPSP